MNKKILLVILLSLYFIIGSVSGIDGPRVYITESVSGTDPIYTAGDAGAGGAGGYGSLSATTRTGTVYVYVPNTEDVLQYVRVNLSSEANTRADVELWTLNSDSYSGSYTAYKNYALSYPALTDKTTMFLNTSTDGDDTDDDLSYTPDYDWAPSLNLTMTVVNTAGGDDLYSEGNIDSSSNIMYFVYTIRNDAAVTGANLTDVTLTMEFNKNTLNLNDSLNITESTISETSGVSTPSNSDGTDTHIDRIVWNGDIDADTTITISFNATIISGINYPGGDNAINLNGEATDIGARATYSNNTELMTQIKVSGTFSRGPVREGVDLISSTPWKIRSFFKNTAESSTGSNLTYNVTTAQIYSVNPTTGQPVTPYNLSETWNSLFASGDQSYTSYVDGPTDDSKPYMAGSFDWFVVWNDTNTYTYLATINTSMQLPTLYEIDMVNTKATTNILPPGINDTIVSITDTLLHTGNADSQVNADNITIISQIPWTYDGASDYRNLTINSSSIQIYLNTTYELKQETGSLEVTVVQSSDGNNGTITVQITNMSNVSYVAGGIVEHDLTTGEDIQVVYAILTQEPLPQEGEVFTFVGNNTLVSQSGTPLTEYQQTLQMTASQNSLSGYKELWISDSSTPTIVNATINVSVTGTVNDIRFMDYIPADITFSIINNEVNVQNGSQVLVNGTDYYLAFMGYTTLSDGLNVSVWEYRKNVTSGWDITDDYIQVGYKMNISEGGIYTLPVEIAAFDPIVGKSIQTMDMGVVNVYTPKSLEPLNIIDNENFKLAKSVIVGTPALWIKDFEVYNPNQRSTVATFTTSIFEDTLNVYASYYNVKGEKLEESLDVDTTTDGTKAIWESTIYAMESRLYTIGVTTPPVITIDRNTEVIDKLEDKQVKIKTDIFLKNLAKEEYTNVKLNTIIAADKIIEVKDAFGNELEYTGGESSSTIIIPAIEAEGLRTISIIYKQSYPTIIVNTKNSKYDSGTPGYLEILIINGGDNIEKPYIESEIYTQDLELIHLNIQQLEDLEPLEKTEFSEKFIIPLSAPSGMYIANIKFKEDFTTLAETTGQFYVTGAKASTGLNALYTLILLLAGGFLAVYLNKRIIKTKSNQATDYSFKQ
ncbi:MAG: hypothetical protein K0B02_04055 [DPANN group archaeon]|nr:hypothetical protein [DPANN group archaeon]